MLSNNPAVPNIAIPIITELELGLSQIKPNWIEGIYLTGSITLGDFYSQKSDVDFLVLYNEFPTQEVINQLIGLHHRIQQLHPKPVLNGVYLTQQNLQASNLGSGHVIHFQDGKLSKVPFEMGAITLYELQTTAYTITGTPTSQLPIDIDLEQLKRFMHTNINSYWQKWLTNYSSMLSRKGLLVLFPILTEWGILGVARQLYTLKQGKIVSKRVAGSYCLEEVPASHQPIIEEALRIRMTTPSWANLSLKNMYTLRPSWRRATSTTACMQYLINQFNTLYLASTQPTLSTDNPD